MSLNKNDYVTFGDVQIYFPLRDQKKVERMRGKIKIVSTVCPDYSNDGSKYIFSGELGRGVSLTAQAHLIKVPPLIKELESFGLNVFWHILVADLPELTEKQREFYCRVARSREEYISRCEDSVKEIAINIQEVPNVEVETFSSFYGRLNLPYLQIQEMVAERILVKAENDEKFRGGFNSFLLSRKELAAKFRGRQLSAEEYREAAAHGMSLYVTHGTLLRRIFAGENMIVINHFTPNLQNFYLCDLVPGYEGLINTQKFPLGIIDEAWY